MKRSRVLFRAGNRFSLLLEESVPRYRIGDSETMAGQAVVRHQVVAVAAVPGAPLRELLGHRGQLGRQPGHLPTSGQRHRITPVVLSGVRRLARLLQGRVVSVEGGLWAPGVGVHLLEQLVAGAVDHQLSVRQEMGLQAHAVLVELRLEAGRWDPR
ncbi:hypothetical protein [Streptomyces sp. LaBMicrA B280]|uniref:hypothetical protein n=1 Tax=Streptomyces sp. LaBMicrA B280 TaxID=3391001 RepID=UPI003BA46E6C